MNRRIIPVVAGIVVIIIGWYVFVRRPEQTIKIGVLHSLTGTMAISEKSLVDSVLLATDEINQKGGVLGQRIEPIVVDGRSDWQVFASEAERLITQEHVVTLFGCWTSACRKTVRPVVEKYDNLLVYPLQYEGLEESPNIVYTGAAPNQQIIPAIKWSLDHLGKRFFLIGSDYVFPRTANQIIKDQLTSLEGEVVGEEYVLLGSRDLKQVVGKIANAKPDVIINTLNGDSNVALFRELRLAGITPQKIPTMSFSLAEEELHNMPVVDLAGNYAVWNYFQTIDSEENRSFVKRFQKRYGASRVTDDPIEAAYFGVYLWAQAVEEAGQKDPDVIRNRMKDQSMNAPEGIVYIDAETQHTWKTVRIGKIRPDGQFEIVWSSEMPIRPVPFPGYRTRAQWEELLGNLYRQWGGRWANPGTPH